MAFCYSKLSGRIVEIFGTQSAFAISMGFSKATLSQKLNNKTEFSQEEIYKAINLLKLNASDIPLYFFTPKV